MLRIAHLASPYHTNMKEMGGTVRNIYDLARKQCEEGHEVTVIAAPTSRIEGCDMIAFVGPTKVQKNWLLNWFSQRMRRSQHVYKSFKWLGSRFDVVHNHLGGEEGIALTFLRKSPCITILNGTAPAPTQLIHYTIKKLYAVPRNTKLVALSKSSYLDYRKFYGDDLIGYVYRGVDASRLPYFPKPEKSHDIELCYLGRIDPGKGVHIATKVADILHRSGYDVHLKLVGLFDPRYINYFVKTLKIAESKSYVDMVVNVPASKIAYVLGNSDALLFPTLREEPFGLVQIEAMACGTPVLTFSIGATPEIVQNGFNGFLCKDVSEMAQAVLEIPKIDRRRCRQIVEKKFSVNTMYDGYLKIYEKAIESY